MKIKLINGSVTEYPGIGKIVIYGDGVIKYSTERPPFEENRIDENGKIKSVYNGKPDAIILGSEPKNARLENLNRKDNYLLPMKKTYYWSEAQRALYIHQSEINAEEIGDFIAMQANGETNYKKAFKLLSKHGFEMIRCKMEDIENAGRDFIPPDGCKWSSDYSRDASKPNYDIIDCSKFSKQKKTRVVKRWLEAETINEIIVSGDYYSKCEKDAQRLRREEIARKINEKKCFYNDVSHYEIDRLLQYFDIKEKGI